MHTSHDKIATVRLWLWTMAAAATTAGCGVNFDNDETSSFRCQSAADCDGLTGAEGRLCLGASCDACTADWQCSQVPHYGGGARCTSGRCVVDSRRPDGSLCTNGAEACACRIDGSCAAGLLCDAAQSCRAAVACGDIACSASRRCVPATDTADAHCAERCEKGFSWRDDVGACVAAQSNCAPGQPRSIASSCARQGRNCAEDPAYGARCSECLPNTIESDDECEPAVTCAELQCAAEGRECIAEPNGRCGACLPDYVADDSGEHCLATCDVLNCGVGEECVAQTTSSAAFCSTTAGSCPAVPACEDNAAWNPMWQQCQSCGALDCVADERHTGRVFPLVTNQFRCVCETKDGYYFDNATLSTGSCDADGDGFVRRSAWDALNRETGCALLGDSDCDCALRDNARCKVRSIDRAVLHSIYGDTQEVPLASDQFTKYSLVDGRLELYETDANDDSTLASTPLPVYASGNAASTSARVLSPHETNSFTKACVDATADFNGNQQSDLTEYQGMTSTPGPSWTLPFAQFSYFIEAYDAWYEPSPAGGLAPGSYHFREKARRTDEGAGTQIPFFAPTAAGYDQACHRFVDADYVARPGDGQPNIGMDFARFNNLDIAAGARPLARFGHHSQFKCVQVVDTGDTARDRAAPYRTHRSVADDDYQLLGCSLAQGGELGDIQCAPTSVAALQTGDVLFASVAYRTYSGGGSYERGCVNECEEQATLESVGTGGLGCPSGGGYGCYGDRGDFGRYACGCLETYKGANCEIPCKTWYRDSDKDTFADPGSVTGVQCEPPPGPDWVEGAPSGIECSTTAAANINSYPGAAEICDQEDNDCDGEVDEGLGDVAELCGDGIDNNCNGKVDEGFADAAVGATVACQSGVGACYREGVVGCSTDKLSLECSPKGLPVTRFQTAPYLGAVGGNRAESWDWNCDGVDEPRYTVASQTASQLTRVVEEVVFPAPGAPREKVGEFRIIDAHQFCAAQFPSQTPIRMEDETFEEHKQRVRDVQESACNPQRPFYVPTSRGNTCGAELIKIRCRLADFASFTSPNAFITPSVRVRVGSTYAGLQSYPINVTPGNEALGVLGLQRSIVFQHSNVRGNYPDFPDIVAFIDPHDVNTIVDDTVHIWTDRHSRPKNHSILELEGWTALDLLGVGTTCLPVSLYNVDRAIAPGDPETYSMLGFARTSRVSWERGIGKGVPKAHASRVWDSWTDDVTPVVIQKCK